MPIKPKMSCRWAGVKGNKWRQYVVNVNGKAYHHNNKGSAMTQYNSAMRVYKKRKSRR